MCERRSPTHQFRECVCVCVFCVHAVAITQQVDVCVLIETRHENSTLCLECSVLSIYLRLRSNRMLSTPGQPLFSLAFYVNRRVCYFITLCRCRVTGSCLHAYIHNTPLPSHTYTLTPLLAHSEEWGLAKHTQSYYDLAGLKHLHTQSITLIRSLALGYSRATVRVNTCCMYCCRGCSSSSLCLCQWALKKHRTIHSTELSYCLSK